MAATARFGSRSTTTATATQATETAPKTAIEGRTLKRDRRVFEYTMSKTIKVDDWFHEWIKAEKRDDETMREALVRLTGAPAPDPDAVSGVISRTDGERMKSRIEESDTSSAADVRARFSDDP
jgi:hypothetical protein